MFCSDGSPKTGRSGRTLAAACLSQIDIDDNIQYLCRTRYNNTPTSYRLYLLLTLQLENNLWMENNPFSSLSCLQRLWDTQDCVTHTFLPSQPGTFSFSHRSIHSGFLFHLHVCMSKSTGDACYIVECCSLLFSTFLPVSFEM